MCPDFKLGVGILCTLVIGWVVQLEGSSYTDIEKAVKRSDYELVQSLTRRAHLTWNEKQKLVHYASYVLHTKKEALEDRNVRVLVSILLKCLPFGLSQLIGFCLDQRGLGAILAFLCAGIGTPATAFFAAGITQSPLTNLQKGLAIGLSAGFTILTTAGSIKLEMLLWRWARQVKQKMVNDCENAVQIKEFLSLALAE